MGFFWDFIIEGLLLSGLDTSSEESQSDYEGSYGDGDVYYRDYDMDENGEGNYK